MIKERLAVGFPPIAADSARVLILGSMPGLQSLQASQYYAHPHNAFWKIMGGLFGMPVESYAQRVDLIKGNNLALWDVLRACERAGSLDSSIVKDSIVPNDFQAFFTGQPKIAHVFLNGGTAATAFKKYALPSLPSEVQQRLQLTQLVSTSPAMAGKNLAQKMQEWAVIKRALIS